MWLQFKTTSRSNELHPFGDVDFGRTLDVFLIFFRYFLFFLLHTKNFENFHSVKLLISKLEINKTFENSCTVSLKKTIFVFMRKYGEDFSANFNADNDLMFKLAIKPFAIVQNWTSYNNCITPTLFLVFYSWVHNFKSDEKRFTFHICLHLYIGCSAQNKLEWVLHTNCDPKWSHIDKSMISFLRTCSNVIQWKHKIRSMLRFIYDVFLFYCLLSSGHYTTHALSHS